jgi:hypothetical protein
VLRFGRRPHRGVVFEVPPCKECSWQVQRRNLWYAYSNKLAHRSPTPKPTSHCGSPVEKRIPSASAGKPPHKTAVQVFTRLIARPRAIAVALISVAASTGTPTADCLFLFDAVMRCPGLLPPPNQAGFETQSPGRLRSSYPDIPMLTFCKYKVYLVFPAGSRTLWSWSHWTSSIWCPTCRRLAESSRNLP